MHDHSQGHTHPHGHGHELEATQSNQRRLVIALSITAVIAVAEVAGGILGNSLALLSDAGHMITDAAALGLSLFALILTKRASTLKRTYGFYRAEIMAALTNGAVLILVAAYIVWEAYQRIFEPVEVRGGLMLVVAIVGLLGNVAGILVLGGASRKNLNIRGAFWHMLSDAISSVGVIAAAIIIYLTGWNIADPIVSILISLLILRGAASLVRDSSNILLEAVPKHVDLGHLVEEVKQIEGARDMHDVHVWTISSGLYALSAHVLTDDQSLGQCSALVENISDLLRDKYAIGHTTLQLECESCGEGPTCQLRRTEQ